MPCSDEPKQKTFVAAICGASGAIYGLRLLKALLERDTRIYLIISAAGRQVLSHETGYAGEPIHRFLAERGIDISDGSELIHIDEQDFFTPPASGSFRHDGMIICPCTMGTLAAVASGTAGNLIHRAADVCLKEKRPLILVPRETPLSPLHLSNMLKAARAGATILPAMPSFYGRPGSIDELADTVIARILDHLNVAHDLVKPWALP